MSDLRSILKEEYGKKATNIDAKTLMEMVEETLDLVYDKVILDDSKKEQIQEMATSQAKEFLLVLPKFVPTEAWGDPNSMEREQITRLFSVIGGGRSIEGKLTFLQRIANPNNKITSPRRIISSLIILESLSAVINSFNASSAGFVFEGFLSALLQGAQESEYSAKGNLPIQDLIAFEDSDNPIPISLKLLNQTTNIEGSYTNLIDGIAEFGHMVYIVARKDGESIAIEEFTFTKDNFIDALSTTARGGGKASGLNLFKLPDMNADQSINKLKSVSDWGDKYEMLQYTAGYSARVREKRKISHAEFEGGVDQNPETSLEEVIRQEWRILTENKGGTQWSISPSQLKSFSFIDYKTYGLLPYSAAQLEQIASIHMDKLNGELHNLFAATQMLSENITKYFTFDKRDRAISSGEKAIKNTTDIQSALAAQISSTETEEGP
jgi:hypothetical protein